MRRNGAVGHHSGHDPTAPGACGSILTRISGPYDGPTGTGGRGIKGNLWN